MRVRLTLLASKQATLLPLNYNHAVASLIYDTLGSASTEFATRLHDEGFKTGGRSFKLFTFSRLAPRRSRLAGDRLLLEDPTLSMQISSPVSEFVEHFVSGLFQRETFQIAGASFTLQQAETLSAPVFTDRMSFRAISPITESVRDAHGGVRFLSPEDDWSEIIWRNLLRKHEALHGHTPACERPLRWTWDQAYLAEAARRGRRASVLTDIRGIKVRGWLVPFTVEGSKELIELGYEAGYGSRNSMGFGMAE
ncbi:MAG TPA: CRISPR-associated endoribonuclease Cas6 [Pyrinomonadaceae bacterium]|jgi:CRISPR-associated endoribonuclease Cas6